MNRKINVVFKIAIIGHTICDIIKLSAYGWFNYVLSNYTFYTIICIESKFIMAIKLVQIKFSNSYLFFSIFKLNWIANGQSKPKPIIGSSVYYDIMESGEDSVINILR